MLCFKIIDRMARCIQCKESCCDIHDLDYKPSDSDDNDSADDDFDDDCSEEYDDDDKMDIIPTKVIYPNNNQSDSTNNTQ